LDISELEAELTPPTSKEFLQILADELNAEKAKFIRMYALHWRTKECAEALDKLIQLHVEQSTRRTKP
jgi:hypothetical protein